jgi:hypothetical protein
MSIAATANPAAAQPGTCYKCTYSSGSYNCIPAGDGLGNRTCQVLYGQGCVLGSICGYYSKRPDGTFEDPARRAPRMTSPSPEGSTRGIARTAASTARSVSRGCNETIIGREYSAEESRRLARAARVINI